MLYDIDYEFDYVDYKRGCFSGCLAMSVSIFQNSEGDDRHTRHFLDHTVISYKFDPLIEHREDDKDVILEDDSIMRWLAEYLMEHNSEDIHELILNAYNDEQEDE